MPNYTIRVRRMHTFNHRHELVVILIFNIQQSTVATVYLVDFPTYTIFESDNQNQIFCCIDANHYHFPWMVSLPYERKHISGCIAQHT
jgi:hypothetical protein